MADKQVQEPTAEESFRSTLDDCCVVMKKLMPLCKTVQECVDLCEFAILNDAQLQLLMQQITPLQLKK